MTKDIVERLRNRYAGEAASAEDLDATDMLMREAADEIEALRDQLRMVRFDHPRDIRADVLEEAARCCEEMTPPDNICDDCAAYIRALKDNASVSEEEPCQP